MTKKLSICLLVVLAGCAKVDETRTIQVHDEPGPSYFVHDILMKDGTRCVVATSYRSDGGVSIACDWEGPKVER